MAIEEVAGEQVSKKTSPRTSQIENEGRQKRDSIAPKTPPPPGSSKDSVFFCPESHEGYREFINIVLDIPPESVFNILYKKSDFIEEIYTNRKYTEFSSTQWEKNENGEDFRVLTCKALLPKLALGASAASVTQTQTLSKSSCEPHLYIVNCEVVNKDIPYAEYFKLSIHTCITRETPDLPYQRLVQPQQCRFQYLATIKFRRNPVFFVKGLIEKSAYTGLEMLCSDIAQGLEEEAEKANEGTPLGKALSLRKSQKEMNAKPKQPVHEEEKKASSNSSICSWLLFIMLFVVVGINVFLYTKLTLLDDLFRHKMYLSGGSQTPELPKRYLTPGEDVLPSIIQSMREQEEILTKQSIKWKEHLQKAVDSLKEVEEILEEMLSVLPMYLVEHQRVSTLEEIKLNYEQERNDESKK